MRKLILTSIRAKTGDLEWEEDRLVVVNHNQGDVEEDLLKKAAAHAKNWLETERPNSEYLAIVPKATIGQEETPVKAPTTYGHEYELSLAGNFTPEYPALTATATSLKYGKTETHSFNSPEDFARQAMEEIVDHLNDEMVDKGTVTKIKITIKAEY